MLPIVPKLVNIIVMQKECGFAGRHNGYHVSTNINVGGIVDHVLEACRKFGVTIGVRGAIATGGSVQHIADFRLEGHIPVQKVAVETNVTRRFPPRMGKGTVIHAVTEKIRIGTQPVIFF